MVPVLPVVLGITVLALLYQSSKEPQRSTYGNAPPRPGNEGYGAVPPAPAAAAPASSVLKSAALAAPGSWTRRNVLQAGAQSAYQRRLAGTATEADFAVLRAARPGITSGQSGPISPAWSGSPWQPEPAIAEEASAEDIGDAVVKDMFMGVQPTTGLSWGQKSALKDMMKRARKISILKDRVLPSYMSYDNITGIALPFEENDPKMGDAVETLFALLTVTANRHGLNPTFTTPVISNKQHYIVGLSHKQDPELSNFLGFTLEEARRHLRMV